MSRCIFMKGLPGSGKSTYYRENLSNYLRFNRDDARLDNPTLKEHQIAALEKKFMKDNTDKNVCIDNCHLWWSLFNKILMAQDLWYEVSWVDMFDVLFPWDKGNVAKNLYLDLSLRQNSEREWNAKVPESVIYQMFLENYWDNDFVWPVVVVDIDWTIANIDHRLHYMETKPKDHNSFYAEVKNDSPINDVISLANTLSSEYTIIYVSGRRNQTYRDTKERMGKHWVLYDFILMRNWRDHRPDTEVKREIYDRCLKDLNVVMVMDDRPCVQAVWRDLWLRVLDCNSGRGEF